MDASANASRIPNLSNLTIALLEHAVKPILGDEAINVLKTPYNQNEIIKRLSGILIRSEARFISECTDRELKEGILNLKFSDLPSVKQAFWLFYKSPGSLDFLEVIKKTLKNDFVTISSDRIDKAVKDYLRILYKEMLSIDQETREKLIVIINMEIKDNVERIANGVEKIVDILDFKIPKDQTTLKQGDKLDACIIFNGMVESEKIVADGLIIELQTRKVVAHDFAHESNLGLMEVMLFDIRRCETLVTIISKELNYSEINIALLRHAFNNKIRILPIRVGYLDKFNQPVNYFIPDEKPIIWKDIEDSAVIAKEVNKALSGKPYGMELITPMNSNNGSGIPRPTPAVKIQETDIQLEHPKGTMDPESKFYISRSEDRVLENELKRDRFIITIKGSRQMGKSSMLIHGCAKLDKLKKTVAYIDFQRFEKNTIKASDIFYRVFCETLIEKLGVDLDLDQYWNTSRLGNLMKCSNILEKYILPYTESDLVIAMDEADLMIDAQGRSDFFGMLRSWHNDRSEIWKKLNLILVVSTEPFLLIDNLNQSPFNIGTILTMKDFNSSHVNNLNQLHNIPFTDAEINLLMEWVGGHPFLVRQAFYDVAAGIHTSQDFFRMISRKDGPYGDHLVRQLLNLSHFPELLRELKQLLLHNIRPSENSVFRLESAGLIREDNGIFYSRNKLYEVFLRENLQ